MFVAKHFIRCIRHCPFKTKRWTSRKEEHKPYNVISKRILCNKKTYKAST